MFIRVIIVSIIFFSIDLYVFRSIRIHSSELNNYIKYTIYIVFWLIPAILLSLGLFYNFFPGQIDFRSSKLFLFIGAFFVVFTLPKIIILSFQLIEDVSKILAFILKKFSAPDDLVFQNADKISRSVFISRLGLIISAIPFFVSLYGILVGRFNFNVV